MDLGDGEKGRWDRDAETGRDSSCSILRRMSYCPAYDGGFVAARGGMLSPTCTYASGSFSSLAPNGARGTVTYYSPAEAPAS